MRALVMAGVVALAACTPADPAATLAQNARDCEEGMFPDQRIAACSRVVANSSVAASQRAAALLTRGMLRAELGQHARAVADFGRAIRLDATLSDAYAERGLVHYNRGAFERALRDYDAALAIDPLNSLAVYRRDQALEGRAGAVRRQIETLSEALAREPQNTSLLNNRCWVRAINDVELEAALADCNAALLIDAGNANVLDSRGLVHLKRGAFEMALADYEAALVIDPGRGHYLYGRGMARWAMGRQAEAEQDFAAAEADEPGTALLYQGYNATPDTFSVEPGASGAQP